MFFLVKFNIYLIFCIHKGYGPVYFISFIIICNFISLNISILILLQVFEEFHINPSNFLDILKKKIEDFEKIWGKYSEYYGGIKILEKDILKFFKELNTLMRKYKNINIRLILLIN